MFTNEEMPAPLKVMIVEDEMFLAMDLENHLEDLGQDVVGVAASAAEAFALASVSAPDLALVDVNLRDGASGPRIASELARKHDMLVVFVTGSPDQIPPDYARGAGCGPEAVGRGNDHASDRVRAGMFRNGHRYDYDRCGYCGAAKPDEHRSDIRRCTVKPRVAGRC